MNIQNYMTMETLLSLLVVGAMALIYISFRLTGRLHNHLIEDDDEYEVRPNSGQLWYKRTGPFEPFLNKEDSPIKILEFRYDKASDEGWVRCNLNNTESILSVDYLVENYMQDDFKDIPYVPFKKEELEIEIEFEKEKPAGNILTLDGKDYVLAPV